MRIVLHARTRLDLAHGSLNGQFAGNPPCTAAAWPQLRQLRPPARPAGRADAATLIACRKPSSIGDARAPTCQARAIVSRKGNADSRFGP